MARGGRAKLREGPERRCVATGESAPTEGLIRFALSPEGVVVPDLAERLPGRGVWVTARRDLVEKAVKRKLFARGFKTAAAAPADLSEQIEAQLARRAVEALGLARKAGLAVAGFEKAKARLKAGPVAALIEAADGSEQGRAKLRPLAGDAPVCAALDATELGLAFGRDFVIHAVLDAGGAADRVVRESRRLAGFRSERSVAARAADDPDDDGEDAMGRDGAA
ncbi:MAG: RNA-binding protein [Rubrimonas sp.]